MALVAAIGAVEPAFAQSERTTRVVGTVKDENNAISLPGVPVEVVATKEVVYTDVDGRFVLQLPPGTHEVAVAMEGYQTRTLTITIAAGQRTVTANIGLTMAAFAETVTVTARAVDAQTSSAEAQLTERRNSQVISDNMGSQEMRANGDSDAASAMARVTGMSLVDNQYVFVRGLGERYSNTTLAGSTLPTTEPDKKVVPLDLFPAGLIDSVQVAKSYTPDKSAEFAGGLVQIVPLKFPSQPVVDFSYGLSHYSTATGKQIPLSPINGRDFFGFDNDARALPSGFPTQRIQRQGLYTPSIGVSAAEITELGRKLDNTWRPQLTDGAPGQNWGMVFGNRFDKLGVIASMSHSYKEQYVEEERNFFSVGANNQLETISAYQMQTGSQKAQLGIVGNVAYQFTSNHRISFENLYTHSGKDEGRFFEGANTDNVFWYRDSRLQFIEEGLISNALGGEHFFQNLSNSRIDWRVAVARAARDEPDLRETLYQSPLVTNADGSFSTTGTPVLADESQSGFRMFNELNDDTIDASVNWSTFRTGGSRATQFKFGASYVERTRDFQSRRFHFIPVTSKDNGLPTSLLSQAPEQIFTSSNIGSTYRLTEETRPTDAYDGEQTTLSGYGMIDVGLTSRSRLVAGARVEQFDQVVNSFDPFGFSEVRTSSENKNTDIFPSVNFVQSLTSDMNLRLGYSTTVNRPEFRELAEFEFTDIVGNYAVKGNPNLKRALIQNVDARWEKFGGARGVLAASAFYKRFDQPIERIIVAGAQPLATFQNADNARNFGFELEAARGFGDHFYFNANYTFVDSQITLGPEEQAIQTSQQRPLAGQSKNLFNVTGELSGGGASARLLFNFYDDRIADVGANEAPDVIEQGRGSLDFVLSYRWRGLGMRLNIENLTDSDYRYTQSNAAVERTQRLYNLGRTVGLSFSYNVF
ncbi:MAG: carboxypeptidase regulatory-like domain-containing protein [Vicinamibacterales bacterium]